MITITVSEVEATNLLKLLRDRTFIAFFSGYSELLVPIERALDDGLYNQQAPVSVGSRRIKE